MLAAAAHGGTCDATKKPWASPWCSKMPTVAHVVKRVTESDNLGVAGQPPATYVTEYDYRDPVFEGRQREFRGFKKARARRLGDANSPITWALRLTSATAARDPALQRTLDPHHAIPEPSQLSSRRSISAAPSRVTPAIHLNDAPHRRREQRSVGLELQT